MSETVRHDPATLVEAGPDAEVAEAIQAGGSGRRLPTGVGFWLAAVWLALVVLLALLAPVLPLRGPAEDDFSKIRQPAFESFDGDVFGADQLGRSVLSRAIHGGRVSLRVGFGAVAIGLAVGGVVGMAAGYFRGRLDAVINVVTDVGLAFPPLILLLTLAAIFGGSAWNITFALAALSIPTMIRLARANTMVFAQREFVTAARAMGAKNSRILFSEILPNVALPLLSYAFIIVAVVIVAEGSLSFLGVGIQRPIPSWGGMIDQGRQELDNAPHIVAVPAVVMFLTVLAFNRVGEQLRQIYDPRSSQL